MINHPDRPPPGLAAPDGAPPRRRVVGRRAALVALGLSAVVLASVFGARLIDAAIGWLQRQPAHQLPFDRIELVEPVPSWVRPGRAGFLDRVRRESNRPETLPALSIDLDELARDFKLSPWVREVIRVERRHPNRLLVTLRYREPAAWVAMGATPVYLDADGVVLPADEVEPEGLTLLKLQGLEPTEALAGRRLKARRIDGADVEMAVIESLAKLAGFLRDAASTPSKFRPAGLAFTEPRPGAVALWVIGDAGQRVRWAVLGGPDPGRKPDAERWALLRDRDDRLAPDQYLVIDGDGVHRQGPGLP